MPIYAGGDVRMFVLVKSGFTLIEMLVVMAIISTLIGLGAVGYETSIERSKKSAGRATFSLEATVSQRLTDKAQCGCPAWWRDAH